MLLQPGRIALSTVPMMQRLRATLKDFSDEDYLLPTGDTAAIVAASLVAANFNRGRIKVLSWDRTTKTYIPINLQLNGE